MTTSNRPDVAEMTKLASALQSETAAFAARTAKHDTEAQEIARVRADLSKRAEMFARLASDSRAHTAQVLGKVAAPSNGKPVKAKAKRRNRKPKGPAKYRNPDNPKQTWTGMGTVPNWIRGSNQPKESFLIQPSA